MENTTNTGDWNTGDWNTGDLNTGNRNTGDGNIGNRNTGNRNTGDLNTGDLNTGDWNAGDLNTGDLNTGNRNTGDWNTGNFNTGYRNTGNRNTGNGNIGDRNTGDRNTGNRNTGNGNIGNRNTGDRNTGDWNTGNFNTGYFNIDEPKVRIFGKETDIKREDIIFPKFCYFDLTEWIYESDMTEEQKTLPGNEYYKTTGGILIEYDYKEAFQKSYNSLSKEEKEKQTEQLKALPNFDKNIFFEISGINIEEKEVEEIGEDEIILNGVKYKKV